RSYTLLSARALTVISGPLPKGSPMEIPRMGLIMSVSSSCIVGCQARSAEALFLVLLQDQLQLLDALVAQVVEGLAAVAHGIAQHGHGLLDDGVGVAELEHPLQRGHGVLHLLGLVQLTGHEVVVDG